MSNYVAANINNEGRSITPTNDDGYNYYNNNNNNNNLNTNTQNLNIKTRKKSSNKTNLRNLKRNEKFFKKFQQEIESSTALLSSTTTISINNNNTTSSSINPTFVSNLTTANLLRSTSTTVIPPIITTTTNRKHSNLIDLNDNDLFDSRSSRSSNQIMNAITINNKPNNFKKISAIPIKTKNNDINNKQSQLPANSTLIHQTDSSPNHQMSKQSKKSNPVLTQTIDQTTVSLEDFNSSKNMSDEFDMDLKPVFSKSLANKIKNHYKSINSESVYNSIDSNADMVSDTSISLTTSVVPALINDKFFKNNNKHSNLIVQKPKPLNSKVKHSKSNSFESSSFLLNENGFASKNVSNKLKQLQKK